MVFPSLLIKKLEIKAEGFTTAIRSLTIKINFSIILLNKKLKTVSWNAISREALAKTTPLNPPIVNINTKPKANNMAGVKCKDPP
jgi:hypothetical protein